MKKKLLLFVTLLLWIFQAMPQQDRLKSALENVKQKRVFVDWQNEMLKKTDNVKLNNNEVLVIMAYGNRSSGYSWTAESDNKAVTIENIPLGISYEPSGAPGASVYQRIIVKGAAGGEANVTLRYHRLWEKTKAALATRTIKVTSKGAYKGAFKYVPAQKKVVALKESDYVVKALPSAFDWAAQGKSSPVKDQESCGSCWAFGLTAGFESKIMIKDNVTRDIAEQYLVSCNQNGFGCSGGWWAADYYCMKTPPGESGAGAVYESDFPYQAIDAPCNAPHTHHEQIESWAYTDDIADGASPTLSHNPTVEEIKNKLYTYGPIPTALAIDNWNSYTGGVLTTDNNPSGTAHIVLITGWDDANQCWIIKNSWGSDWGESGYIRQRYGINNVSYSIYLKYKESTAPSVVYGGNEFYENKANNGGILQPINLNLINMGSGQGFYTTSGTMSQGTHFTVSNLPSGLSASIQVTSRTSAKITLNGYASSHLKSNSISNLTVTFTNSAFSGVSASSVTNYNYNQLKIYFWDPYQIVYKDIADLTNSTGDPWKSFNLGEGNSSYGLWYSYYYEGTVKKYCFFIESYSKEGMCTSTSTADGYRRLKVVQENSSIGPSSTYWVNGGGWGNQLLVGSDDYTSWVGKTAYVGIRFSLNAGVSYGWLRIYFSGSGITLYDYAYNQQPDAPILAGQKTGGTTTDTQPPSTPTYLQAGTATQTSIALSWNASTDNVGVTGYDIYRGSTLAGSSSGTSYTVTGLTCNTSYTFSVRARDAAGNTSSASNSVSKSTLECGTTEYCESKGSSVQYEWIQSVQIGSYTKNSGSNSGYGNFTSETVNVSNGTSVTLTPGFASGAYTEHWKIWIDVNKNQVFDSNEEVFSSSGNAAVSGTISLPSGSGTTRMRVSMKYNAAPSACETLNYGEVEDYTVNMGGSTNDTQAPSVPTNVTVTGTSSSSVSLSWTASTDNVGVTGYTINNATTSTNYTSSTNSYTVTGLAANTNYTFYINAKDAAGNTSGWSSAIQATTSGGTDTQAPSTPTNVTVTSTTSSSISLSWTASTDNVGVTSYTVNNATSNTNYTATTNSYTATGLAANTYYTFYINAKDAAGNTSGWSSSTQGKTDDGTIPTNYCTASGTSGPEYISNVSFGSINNSSSRDTYHDYTNVSTSVNKGSTYTLTVSVGQIYNNDKVTAWIDWNGDGDFADSGEKYTLTVSGSNATGSINVPSSASASSTRMRIRLFYYAASEDPCGAKQYGEVEDYTVNISSSKAATIANANNVTVYPNPASGILNVDMPDIETATIKIISIGGNLELKETINGPTAQIDISSISSGIYNVSIDINGKNITNSVIVIQ